MSQIQSAFLLEVLSKVARRYTQRGQLNGVMKIGTSLKHEQLQILYNFFGIPPIRINNKEEVRLHFAFALENAPESEWIKKISSHLGYKVQAASEQDPSQAIGTLINRLKLAFPDLEAITEKLDASQDDLKRMLKNETEANVTTFCFQAAEALRFLLGNKTPITISELGARFFNNSKLLRQGEARHLILRWLNVYCPDLDKGENEDQIWATYHVYHDRLTVNAVIYAPIVYTKNGKEFDWIFKLYEQGEAATISWANLQGIEKIQWKERIDNPPNLICCENEAPFSQLIRQKADDCIIFTSGFPGSAVCKIYELLGPQAAACFHWGDTDPNGLYIGSLLHSIYPLQLFRCGIETLRQHTQYLLPLSQKQEQRARFILQNNPHFPFRKELAYTLENGWMEQENWRQDV
jgi:hypothetical protein